MNVSSDQGIVFAVFLATLAMFVWGRWRYDIVSLGALLLVFMAGLVPTGRVGSRPTAQVATITGIVVLCSGFMNNVGALALLMPVAIWMSRQSGRSSGCGSGFRRAAIPGG
ncbi:MAG: hypothetical protein R6V25_03670 [Desulfatiglandales bacterium]